jgi:hypothetical protein
MLETLVLIAAGLFLLGLTVFCIRLMAYIVSGKYKLDQRFNRYCK